MTLAVDKLEKGEKSLAVSRNTLAELQGRIAEKEQALDEIVLAKETGGASQQRAKDKLQGEIEGLGRELLECERTIKVIEAALPELRHEANLERARGEGVAEYRNAQRAYSNVLETCPTSEPLTAFLGQIHDYILTLREAQETFLSRGKSLSDILSQEKLPDLGGITPATLQADQEGADQQPIISFADQLLHASEKLAQLGRAFFGVRVEYRNLQFRIETPPEPRKIVKCPCGKHEARPNDRGYDIACLPYSPESGGPQELPRWGACGPDADLGAMFPCSKKKSAVAS